MSAARNKQVPAARRTPEPPERIDAKPGPAMLALPTDRHREFVRALYQVKAGTGAAVRAARASGWGNANSSAQSMATISSRLMHDDRVLAAIHEEDLKHIRGVAPRAITALARLVENPQHRDHARAIGMTLDRVHPLESLQKISVTHEAAPSLMDAAQVMKRIAELTELYFKPTGPTTIGGTAKRIGHDR